VAHIIFLLYCVGLEPGKNTVHSKLTLYSPLSSNNIGTKRESFSSHNFH
jgi:hypothetical protein